MGKPASYGGVKHLGAVDPSVALTLAQAGQASAARAGGKTGSAIAAGIGTTMTVAQLAASAGVHGTITAGLLTGAGVSSATGVGIPVGVALGVAAGVVALVAHMRKGRMTRGQAMALAAQLKIPGASEVVGWTRRVLQAKPEKRPKMAARVYRQIRTAGKAWPPASLFRNRARLRTKLMVVNAVIALDQAAAMGQAPPPGPPPGSDIGDLVSEYGPVVGLGMLAVVVLSTVTSKSKTKGE